MIAAIPQPPAPTSPRDKADRAIFRQTRSLKGTPRWTLAQSDADLTKLLSDFDCALGAPLTAKSAPRLLALLIKAAPDVDAAFNTPKDFYKKMRPFMRDRGAICVPRSKDFDKSFDYPSGHATWSWAIGLILARIAPDRAPQILQRARAIGESRVVCGVHSASAVEAGRTAADTVVSALAGDPAFRKDVVAAREEIVALRASAPKPDAGVCREEATLIAKTPW